MVIDAETPYNPADASTAVVHRGTDGGDDLIKGDQERVSKTNVSDKTTEGSESFSPGPNLQTAFGRGRLGHDSGLAACLKPDGPAEGRS